MRRWKAIAEDCRERGNWRLSWEKCGVRREEGKESRQTHEARVDQTI
jgi:hypothetical protein